jgi:uncharacterized lipoprotein YmbA
MTRNALSVLLLAAGLGCLKPSPAPPVVYHTLAALVLQAPAPPSAIALEVLPVRLPDLLLRPQMVVARGSGLGLLDGDRWASPLDQEMQRVLVADLALLLGSDAVLASPGGERLAAPYRLAVTVDGCDTRAGGGLTLQATWMVWATGAGPCLLLRRSTLREPLLGQGPEALAAAHSRVLAALGREIAAALRALPAGDRVSVQTK